MDNETYVPKHVESYLRSNHLREWIDRCYLFREEIRKKNFNPAQKYENPVSESYRTEQL